MVNIDSSVSLLQQGSQTFLINCKGKLFNDSFNHVPSPSCCLLCQSQRENNRSSMRNEWKKKKVKEGRKRLQRDPHQNFLPQQMRRKYKFISAYVRDISN